MTQPTITIALGAERNSIMITIRYRKSPKHAESFGGWVGANLQVFADRTFVNTYLYIETDKETLSAPSVWLTSISNPLRQIRNRRKHNDYHNLPQDL